MEKIILASGSPRRRQLLNLAEIPHEVIVSGADETISGHPEFQVQELALRKARAVQSMLDTSPIILAADTLVFVGGKVLGKPQNEAEAFEMLNALSGQRHTVYTGVAILCGETKTVFADAAHVHFHTLSEREINAYIATGEPMDKAGAYGVQERGAYLVSKIDGDFYTVVGLPISRVCRSLGDFGFDVWKAGTARSGNRGHVCKRTHSLEAGFSFLSDKKNPQVAGMDITGVGVDIVKVERFENLSPRFCERVFTEYERGYAKTAQSAAGIFAAKEAVAKALGTGFIGISPGDIEIRHKKNGAPYAVVPEAGKKIHLSISHTATDAIAYAVAE